jgi:hypothetical protein
MKSGGIGQQHSTGVRGQDRHRRVQVGLLPRAHADAVLGRRGRIGAIENPAATKGTGFGWDFAFAADGKDALVSQ